MILGDEITCAGDQQLAALVAIRVVALVVGDVAHVGVAEAGGPGHCARALERRDGRRRQIEQLVVRVEAREVNRHVGPEVVVERDALLRPFTLLEGRTAVRAGASVGPFVRLVDMEIGPGAQVLDHCLLRESVLEAGASVGPFAHLRPGSRVGASSARILQGTRDSARRSKPGRITSLRFITPTPDGKAATAGPTTRTG